MSEITATVKKATAKKEEFKPIKINIGLEAKITRAVDYKDLKDLVEYKLYPKGFAEQLMSEVFRQIENQL